MDKYKGSKREEKYQRKYRLKYREKRLAYDKKWQKEHREHRNVYMKEYNKKVCTQRRVEYMADKFCPHCGTTENLVLHHINPNSRDPALKNRSDNNQIWKWCDERRIKELQKCIVVCRSCHRKIHIRIQKNG